MPDHRRRTLLRLAMAAAIAVGTTAGVVTMVYPHPSEYAELPNRIPEPPPYVTAEAQFFPPPFEESWQTNNHSVTCQGCHKRIFDEWNGSMMANAWRDPAWRAAFLLSARQISTHGNCDAPAPPDGTAKASLNPFATATGCETRFDFGAGRFSMSRSGSLVDGFCSRCHMPTNYVDNVPLQNVAIDEPSGVEHGAVDVHFNPTSDNGTGLAFATVADQLRNTESGKSGVVCMVCHSLAATRDTPFHNHAKAAVDREYTPTLTTASRAAAAPAGRDVLDIPDGQSATLGYGVGGGAFRLSPHAIGFPERLGPLMSAGRAPRLDTYLTDVFKRPMASESIDSSKHDAYRHVLSTRAEFCSTCHDVTNHLTIRNALGKWVGGFPIERTYDEWANSRYADRPGNRYFDPAFKRDCQTCHMQQDYGHPGTARTLYDGRAVASPLVAAIATDGKARTYFTHHFVGGNAYVPAMIGADLDETGSVHRYPELSTYSFSSADEHSVYANAYWTNIGDRDAPTQQARLAWDRLLNVLELKVSGPATAKPGATAPLTVSVTNGGSGHNFPTGFPEGRVAWVAVSAVDLATGKELPIADTFWKRTSLGVGRFTTTDMVDPSFPGCGWKIPAGSPDPYAYQFKAVATRGDDCPTLELVFATPRNLVTNANGLPIDARGIVIDKQNPRGLPIFRDLNGNGDLYDDAFLRDTRLRPLPHAGATVTLDRYSVVIPPGTRGPVAVSTAVYYQSLEAMVAKKFLGNLADTDTDFLLEPCVLGGACDGRRSRVEPPVVEGAPPVPMAIRNWVIRLEDGADHATTVPTVSVYPPPGAANVFQDAVVKALFSEPVSDLDNRLFTLADAAGARVPASVHQIGDGTWGLFTDRVFLNGGETYTARIAAGVCGFFGNCTAHAVAWTFTIAAQPGAGIGDTTIPLGFSGGLAPLHAPATPTSTAAAPHPIATARRTRESKFK